MSPLYISIRKNHISIAKYLLENGADHSIGKYYFEEKEMTYSIIPAAIVGNVDIFFFQ